MTSPVTTVRAAALDTSKASDHLLMTRIADGDAAAFEEIYLRHRSVALAQACKLCSSRELAEEVAQEAFVSLWRGAHRYRPGLGSVSAWLSTMVRNRAIDAWRRAAARPVEVAACEHGRGQPQGVVAQPHAPERAVVLALIAELPAAQREAVFLAYFGDMTHSEIAACADAPLGTIKGRIRLGLEKLREGYEPQPRVHPTPARARLRAVPSAGPRRPGGEPAPVRRTRRPQASGSDAGRGLAAA